MDSAKETVTAERLFVRYFLPLYPPELRADLALARSTDVNPAGNVRIFNHLNSIAASFAALAPKLMGEPSLVLDFSDASVHRLAGLLTQQRRDQLISPIEQPGSVPPLVTLVTHGSVYVGACAVRNHGGVWLVRNPLWESLVRLSSAAGVGDLAIFQWWLKALSDDETGKPMLSDRYRMHVEVPTMRPEALPVIAGPGRSLPRLTKVRYDSLHKYLRAHLPELRDVGDNFPSPERFAELRFRWLDFQLLGDGRMLLIHGPADVGVHLMWLDSAGFRSSAFFPADASPEHSVVMDGQRLEVRLAIQGKPVVHDMLWWGL